MTDLFPAPVPLPPMAEALRPKSLAEFVGQQHLLGPGKPLRLAFDSGKPHSMILWGPPGVGKTTLARLMAAAFDAQFIALSAVFSGVKDIKDAVRRAEEALATSGKRTILFVDEVHRFNKAQQDAFLPFVERGLLTFVGATTENPSFEVIGALLSRTSVYVLKSLSEAELGELFDRAVREALSGLAFDARARDRVIGLADGDARRLLNLLELIQTAAAQAGASKIDGDWVQNAVARNLRRFDKGGDAFYDQISALHKSVRGSNPDASLYWLVRMLDGGADPLYIGRRMGRVAGGDVRLADPPALRVALRAGENYERLGRPPGARAPREAAIYLSCRAKSNAVYEAYNRARDFVAEDEVRPVPAHLRNAPTKLMKDLSYGRNYRYAHDEPDAYAEGENYFPEGMPDVKWYEPTDRGFEAKIAEKLAYLRGLDGKAKKKK